MVNRDTDGFTLVEILISMLLLTVLLAGSLAMQVTAVRASGDSRKSAAATALAESRIEEFRSADYGNLVTVVDDVDCFDIEMQEDTGCTGPFYTRTTNITNAVGGLHINVAVQWGSAEGPSQISLETERTP